MFWKKKDHIKKVDKLVTWIIIGSAIASIFWLSQTKTWKEITKKSKWLFAKSYDLFGKWMVKIFTVFKKK